MNGNPTNWTLVVLKDGREFKSFGLREGKTTLGRRSANQVVLPDDEFVSGKHAKINVGTDGVWIHDLESTNGLKVNGAPRKAAKLERGDRVEIGGYTLDLRATPGPVQSDPSKGKSIQGPTLDLQGARHSSEHLRLRSRDRL